MSSQRVCSLSTTHPDPLCVHFSSSSRRWGMALFRSSLISLAWRRASCLWRSTGSVYSSLPSGLSSRSWTLRASWNLIPLKAKISSSSWSWIRGSTSCRKALTSSPEGWPSGIYICQPRRKLPITHGVL